MLSDTKTAPTGEAVASALEANGVRFLVTVPDWVQIPLHNAVAARSPRMRTINCCTEDEAFMIAGGLHAGGQRSAIVIQNQGLYAGLNALRGIGLDARLPLVMLIGQFGREVENFDKDPGASRRRVVRLLDPLLELLDIPAWHIESSNDLGAISDAYATATEREYPTAIVFNRNLAWDR